MRYSENEKKFDNIITEGLSGCVRIRVIDALTNRLQLFFVFLNIFPLLFRYMSKHVGYYAFGYNIRSSTPVRRLYSRFSH